MLEALYNQSGDVYAWLDMSRRDIVDRRGKPLAFIDGDSVYNQQGRHIGWWQNWHIRDGSGAVVLFTKLATSLGVARPAEATRPAQPVIVIAPPPHRTPGFRPLRPPAASTWSTSVPF